MAICAGVVLNALKKSDQAPDPATELGKLAAPVIERADQLGLVAADTHGSDVTAAAIAQPGTALAIVFKRADGSYGQIPLTAEQINLGVAHDAIVYDLEEKQAALMPFDRPPVDMPADQIPVAEIEDEPTAPQR